MVNDDASNPTPEPIPPHSEALRRYRAEQGCFFVTKTLFPRGRVLDNQAMDMITSTWLHYMDQMQILLAAFVVMPDHYHLLFSPIDGRSVSERMNAAGRRLHRHLGKQIREANREWQDGFHETRIRSSRQFQAVRHYIHENPMKWGLCAVPEGWKCSSANPEYAARMALPWPWRFEQDE